MQFSVLPEPLTQGTAYHYSTLFPGMFEELYYLLQCATKQDIPKKVAVKVCREVLDERNNSLLKDFVSTRKPNEILIPTEEILEAYLSNDNSDILK